MKMLRKSPRTRKSCVWSECYLAEGEAMVLDATLTFKAGVLYDNFDSRGEYFDGTIDILMDAGNVITVKFSSASIGNGLDPQGFFTFLPSPLQVQIVGGKKDYEGATGTMELRGRILPGGHGHTFFNFDGEIILPNSSNGRLLRA